MDFLQNDFFLLTLTFGMFFLAKTLQKRTGLLFLNPILITIALLIAYLKVTGVSYEKYNAAGHLIEFWLRPAVVALGVPLYQQLSAIKKQIVPLVVSSLVGCIVGIVSVVLSALWLGASREVAVSLAAKSVTTPIAMEVTNTVGGIPSLTAAVVVCVGIFGAIMGFRILRFGHVTNPIAQGFSMGTASHAVGTSKAMEVGYHYGAYSSLGLTLNGIFTALLTPPILEIMGMI
ncbi:MAG: LrgB family protein [Bacteroidales bacterium]|nr:LrgB family protein [Bacteroidales bacterium]MCM1146498.1 LrgB family protein [Bacteroidales bacterium]MCM1207216.1 LrgB family protein [Bacillota bacterium]MCM1509310.1 LrgB family protein [Clostridium sp.]